jgi:hypothetical protein
MKRFPRVASLLMVLPLAITGLVASSGPASATVVVPPGQAGNTCSGYVNANADGTHRWQTCAWADYQYVWFTVNIANRTNVGWDIHLVLEDYIKAGVAKDCPNGFQQGIYVPPQSTWSNQRIDCVITRVPGAYASVGQIYYVSGGTLAEQHSPTLQVQ